MSYRVKFEVEGYQCLRCGHKWVPRNANEEPTICPKCKSPYWNRLRRSNSTTPERITKTNRSRVTVGENGASKA